MRAERLLWRVAMICAVVLLVAPFTPRTSWSSLGGTESGGGTAEVRHSAGWDWIAFIAGIGAIVGLAAGRSRRPRVAGSAIGAGVASVAFTIAAAAALGHWLDLMAGSLAMARWVIHPAPAVAYIAGIAAIGMATALVLLGYWLHPAADGPRATHAESA